MSSASNWSCSTIGDCATWPCKIIDHTHRRRLDGPLRLPLPPALIYSCSGCSDVAQLANEVALRLDHAGVAEMSCIAGVTSTEHVAEPFTPQYHPSYLQRVIAAALSSI
ncbi:putative zinc-binding protein [Litchfieldella rifensis]|uniref:Zinc-binding protein n=1 Tax=Litchfieldella rifensis TaxID=762643 RepID=A0ABV7LHW4_9GAMM